MHTRSVLNGPAAHGSILRRIPVSEYRLREFQEIKVAKHGRRISLLHDVTAGAAGILSLERAVGFHQNSATTSWINAMPALPGFHDHGPLPPFVKSDCMSAKAIAGWACLRGPLTYD